jgi:hypothetical protein
LPFNVAGGDNVTADKRNDKQLGDVLGISDTPASTRIPQATSDHGGHPEGIEVGPEHRRHWGDDDIRQSSGAEGVDMGAGGGGTDVEREGATPGDRKKTDAR